jgi:hypothetical protein
VARAGHGNRWHQVEIVDATPVECQRHDVVLTLSSTILCAIAFGSVVGPIGVTSQALPSLRWSVARLSLRQSAPAQTETARLAKGPVGDEKRETLPACLVEVRSRGPAMPGPSPTHGMGKMASTSKMFGAEQ